MYFFLSKFPKTFIFYKPKSPTQHQNKNPLKSTFQRRRKTWRISDKFNHEATYLERNRLGTSFRDWQDQRVNTFSYRKSAIGF